LLSTLDRVKECFQIDQVIIVADKGVNRKLKLKAINDRGYDYIVSCRLKNLPQKMKEQVLNACDYHTIPIREVFDEQKPHTFTYKVLEYTTVVKHKNNEGLLSEVRSNTNSGTFFIWRTFSKKYHYTNINRITCIFNELREKNRRA
jgi:hypothetical protein